MSRRRRLDALTRQFPPASEGGSLCPSCGGPGTYRRAIERARAGLTSPPVCRSCGEPTYIAALELEHERVLERLRAAGYPVPTEPTETWRNTGS